MKKVWARAIAFVSNRLTAAKDMRLAANYFDEAWYREQNPDIAASGTGPLRHFMSRGHQEGRWPNPEFDPAWYLAKNPDVARSGTNPFIHFIKYGRNEGRPGRAPGQPSAISCLGAGDVLLRLDLAIAQRAWNGPRLGNSD